MAVKCPKCHSENPETKQFCADCGTQLSPSKGIEVSVTRTLEAAPEELSRGVVFAGRYEIIEELGAGGMGRVYRAQDTKLNEEVALKLIRPEVVAERRVVERFRNELKTARRIRHKNVCGMYDFHEEGKTLYLTMEYVRGEDLRSLIHRTKALTVGTAVSVARQVADGLAEAHKLGITHRDLKPGNIMIDKEGQAKIMDFGIARIKQEKGVTGEGAVIGTPEYMSPEQVEGKPADARSDLYALGVILFEMVVGRLPFEGDTAFSIANKHKTEPPPVPKRLVPQIPEGLNKLILRCLEKDKGKRFQTAEEMIADLEVVERALPLTDRALIRAKTRIRTSREITVKLTTRKLLIPAAAAVVLIVFAVLGSKYLFKKKVVYPPPVENSIAVISFENQTGDPAHDRLQKSIPNFLITGLENTHLFDYVATWERMRELLQQTGKPDLEFIDADSGFAACRMGGIKAVVLGSLVKAGDTFMTDVKVLDVETKKLLKSANSRGVGQDSILLAQVDELTRKIAAGLGSSKPPAGSSPTTIAESMTRSPEAYDYFLKGVEEKVRNYPDEARKSFRKAVELDPEFAAAYVFLAKVTGGKDGIEALEKARAYSDKAPEKYRLFIEYSYVLAIEKNRDKALGLIEELVAKYPRENLFRRYLAAFYQSMGDVDKAIAECQKILALDPNFGEAANQLLFLYSDRGEDEKAIAVFEKFPARAARFANLLDTAACVYYKVGRLDDALAKYRDALEIDPNWYIPHMGMAWVYGLKEDYGEALRCLDRYLAGDHRNKWQGHFARSFFLSWLGRWREAFDELQRTKEIMESPAGNKYLLFFYQTLRAAEDIEKADLGRARKDVQDLRDFLKKSWPDEPYPLFIYYLMTGWLELKEGRIDAAKANLAQLESFLSKNKYLDTDFNRYLNDFNRYLQIELSSEIMLAEGSPEKAIEIFRQAPRIGRMNISHEQVQINVSYNIPHLKDVAARAYLKMGEVGKAIAEYERLTTFDPKRPERRLIHPLYYYRLGVLYEQKGMKAKAAEQYQRFLDLWKDAYPGQPEVEEAKKRLTGLG